MGLWIMAGVTFREAARKKILWIGLLAGAAFLTLFGTAMHFQGKDFAARGASPIFFHQAMSGMLQVGSYGVDLLAVLMTVLASVDTLSAEIKSGTIHAIATKPLPRWQVLMGKWIGFASIAGAYVVLMFGGLVASSHWIAGVAPQNPVRVVFLILLECLLVLSLSLLFGTWLSTLANGVLVLGLHGVAFLGGWIEQIGGFTNTPRLVTLGIVASLIMPSESVWRRAVFEMQSPVTRLLPLGPFSNAVAPSPAMMAYALVYLLGALGLAIHHFNRRDL